MKLSADVELFLLQTLVQRLVQIPVRALRGSPFRKIPERQINAVVKLTKSELEMFFMSTW